MRQAFNAAVFAGMIAAGGMAALPPSAMAMPGNAMFMGQMQAAADYLGNGAIEVNKYESEIVDWIRRTSETLNRFENVPATGHPHRYFEQTAIATGSFTDPRNISPSATSPTRVERSGYIKGLTAQTNIGLFDVDVTRQQGNFAYLEAKDIEDIVSAIQLVRAQAIWTGTDTSLSAPTTIQYVGLLTQITLQGTIMAGASIVDGLKAQVAQLCSNVTFLVKPTGIMLNPILGDYIDRECKAQKIELGTMKIGAGVVVSFINTQAGSLPLIPDVFIPTDTTSKYGFSAPPAGFKNYYAVILTESAVIMPYIGGKDGNPNVRIFQLGLVQGLQGQYVGVKFDAIIAKSAAYAHCVVCVQRP